MYHYLQSSLFRPYLVPHTSSLNANQGPSTNLVPGMGMSSKNANANLLIPGPNQALFNLHKQITEGVSNPVVETIIINTTDEKEKNVQTGFGKSVTDDVEENDIDFESSKAVNVEALESPVMRTAVTTFDPKRKADFKSDFQPEVKKSKSKKSELSKLKFV